MLATAQQSRPSLSYISSIREIVGLTQRFTQKHHLNRSLMAVPDQNCCHASSALGCRHGRELSSLECLLPLVVGFLQTQELKVKCGLQPK